MFEIVAVTLLSVADAGLTLKITLLTVVPASLTRSPQHRIKGGFLSVEVDRAETIRRISLPSSDVLGKVVYEENFF